MQPIYKSGRYFFAIAVLAFGVIQFVTGKFMIGFLPVKETIHARNEVLVFFSAVFVIAGISMLFNKTTRGGALIAAAIFLIASLSVHFNHIIEKPQDPGPWTGIGESLGLCGGALILAGIFSGTATDRRFPFPKNKLLTGKILFAVTLLIFAVQHFMYAKFIGQLVPSWIPFQVFWAYIVGIAFLTTSISLLINIKSQLACTLLGCMFLFWIIFLHAPRVVSNPHQEPEWTSLFVALGFCGIFFTIAGLYSIKTIR